MVVILNGSLIHNKKDLCSEYAMHDSIFTTRYHTSHKHRHIDNRFPLFTYIHLSTHVRGGLAGLQGEVLRPPLQLQQPRLQNKHNAEQMRVEAEGRK